MMFLLTVLPGLEVIVLNRLKDKAITDDEVNNIAKEVKAGKSMLSFLNRHLFRSSHQAHRCSLDTREHGIYLIKLSVEFSNRVRDLITRKRHIHKASSLTL